MSEDPYLIPGTSVLRNLFNTRDPGELAWKEADKTVARIIQLHTEAVTGGFNSAHLKSIHYRIFQDVYDWAGKYRTVDLFRGAQPPFARPQFIDTNVNRLMDQLAGEGRLRGLDLDAWTDRSAFYFSELNAIHPFREGNGRTTREFFRELALENGLRLQWDRVGKDDVHVAAKESFLTSNTTNIKRVMFMALDPDPPSGPQRRGKERGIERRRGRGRD
jgi:cell filamentation protein